MEITSPGIYEMPFSEYLRDPVPAGSLSSTFARLLTKYVAAKAIERRRNDKPTRAMNLGTAVHTSALGLGPRLIVWEHDGRTKDGKAERAAAEALIESGAAVAVTADEHAQIIGMIDALNAEPIVRDILMNSRSEVSAFWQDGPVWLRARYDLLGDVAYDYKTTTDTTRRGFAKHMATYGYHQQADFYERGLKALDHPAAGAPLRFICQETEPPYLVQIHEPDEIAREVARVLNDRAIGIYARCSLSDAWPGYEALTAEPVALPGFYFFDNDESLPDEWRLGRDLAI